VVWANCGALLEYFVAGAAAIERPPSIQYRDPVRHRVVTSHRLVHAAVQ
jgi:hypothetical protein